MSCRGGLMTIDSGKIKRNGLCDRRWFLRHGGVAVPLIFVALRAQGAERAGTVEDVKGEAFAEAAAVRRALDRAAPLFLGDTVGTGVESRLGMRLGRCYSMGRPAAVRLGCGSAVPSPSSRCAVRVFLPVQATAASGCSSSAHG